MRILVVTSLYPPHAYGGYEQSCRDVVTRWRAAGHEVTVLTTTTRREGVAGADEPHVRRELEWYWRDHELLRPSPRGRLRVERHNQRVLRRALAQTRPDAVSAWAMGGMSLGLLQRALDGAPLVLVVEDDWLVYAPHVDAWLDAWSRRPAALARLAAAVTGVPTRPPDLRRATAAFASRYLQERAASRGGLAVGTGRVVPLGVDDHDFPLRAPAPRPWRWRLLGVGRIEPRKGFDVAIRALAELPEATLRLVGPSDDRHLAELRALAEDLGVADRLDVDVADRSELAAVYADADALVFPSRWDEPFGLVPLEAMTQATPVVATRSGGAAEFLTDGGNCLAVPVDDPGAVATAVRRLAADETLRATLVREGLVTAAAYTVAAFATGLAALHRAAARC